MISIEPRGPSVRRHRWDALAASRQDRSFPVSRISQTLLVLGVIGISVFYAGADGSEAPSQPARERAGPQTLGTALPLHMNDRVEKWIRRFRTDQRPAFQRLLERQGLYADMIREKLQARGMPEELLYMAMMESGLSPFAVSKASAVGVWQFMGPTAQQYGLRVDEWVDERRDPVRATDAALDYLQYLRDRFGSWYLAAAAYNAGPGRVERVLRRHADGRTGDEELYWEVLEYLPFETREYVPRLVAATVLARNADAFGFQVEAEPAIDYDKVFVPGGTSLARVARSVDADARLIRDLNPQLIRGVTPPGELYPIRVPVGASPMVVASLGRAGHLRRADDD
jgi:membrane-bound lytic murein transglycosylase D